VTPDDRRMLALAAFDLHAATLAPDSPDHEAVARYRALTTTEASTKMSDATVLEVAVVAMRQAANVLHHIAEVTGPTGSLAESFARRSDLTAPAREKRSQITERHRQRAQTLRHEKGLTTGAIAQRMAREDGRDKPYDARQVRRWLGEKGENRTD
jgi:hypothetical protein